MGNGMAFSPAPAPILDSPALGASEVKRGTRSEWGSRLISSRRKEAPCALSDGA